MRPSNLGYEVKKASSFIFSENYRPSPSVLGTVQYNCNIADWALEPHLKQP